MGQVGHEAPERVVEEPKRIGVMPARRRKAVTLGCAAETQVPSGAADPGRLRTGRAAAISYSWAHVGIGVAVGR